MRRLAGWLAGGPLESEREKIEKRATIGNEERVSEESPLPFAILVDAQLKPAPGLRLAGHNVNIHDHFKA